MLPKEWEPQPADGLVLVGPAGDGGYVVSEASVTASEVLISMGLNDDWRFEKDFRRRSGAAVICFDHTVNSRFWMLLALKGALQVRPSRMLKYLSYRRFFASEAVQHRQVMIGYDGPGAISLTTIAAGLGSKSLFLKCDIEGAEYRILDQIVDLADRFSGLVIEFHDADLHFDRIAWFLKNLPGFIIVAFHPNNWGGLDKAGNPIVFEISLARRDLVRLDSTATPPTRIANASHLPDITAEFASELTEV